MVIDSYLRVAQLLAEICFTPIGRKAVLTLRPLLYPTSFTSHVKIYYLILTHIYLLFVHFCDTLDDENSHVPTSVFHNIISWVYPIKKTDLTIEV